MKKTVYSCIWLVLVIGFLGGCQEVGTIEEPALFYLDRTHHPVFEKHLTTDKEVDALRGRLAKVEYPLSIEKLMVALSVSSEDLITQPESGNLGLMSYWANLSPSFDLLLTCKGDGDRRKDLEDIVSAFVVEIKKVKHVEGTVISVEGNSIEVNRGSNDGIRPGLAITICSETKIFGVVKVEEVSHRSCRGTLLPGRKWGQVRVGQGATTRF